MKLKSLICAAGLFSAVTAQAYQADITVNANVDPTAGVTLSDGTALPSSVSMTYVPGRGLNQYKNNIKLWTNSQLDMNVSLGTSAQLTDVTGSNTIPLTVMLNGSPLTTTATVFKYSTIFPNGTASGSLPLPLAITQTTPSATVIAGNYSGVVSLVITQATTKDGVAPSK